MLEYLSTKQVCQLIGCSLSSFYRYCKSGLIKPDFFTPGGHRRFSLLHIRQVFSLHNYYSSKIVAYSRVSKPMVLNYLPFLSKKRFVCARVKINAFCSIFILF